jgi:hypothetical protein
MQVYIHIGTSKTGTTFIQSALRSYSHQLKKAGIYVPCAATFGQASGHHNFAFQLTGDSKFAASRGGLAKLLQELRNQNTSHAVISPEDLIKEVKNYPALNSRSSQAKEVLNTSRHRRAISALLRWRFIGNDVRLSSYAKSLTPSTSEIATEQGLHHR